MMSSSQPNTAGPQCFELEGLDYQPVQECIDSGEGAQLHADNGVVQNNLDDKPSNVPWSNFNGEHLMEYWELEDYGLLQYICDTFTVPSCTKV